MRTLHGRIDHAMLSPDDQRIIFGGKSYALPHNPLILTPATSWLSLARMAGFPVTIKVDANGVIRAATVEVQDCILKFEGPSLTMGHIDPDNAP
jgi:hypothetical protein